MFGNKPAVSNPAAKVEKLPGPKEIPGLVQNYLVKDRKMDPDLVRIFKATVRKREGDDQKAFNIRIFDEGDTTANKVQIKDYTTFDTYPNLIVYDGWFSETTKQVELTEKKSANQDVTILSLDEIQKQIEALTEPGSTTFFYMARGPSSGGPLGRGASVVELTPQVEGKKQKKYKIYCATVVDMKPVGKGDKLWDSDKAKDIAKWIKEAHHKRLY